MRTLLLLAVLLLPVRAAEGSDDAWKALLSLAGVWEGSYEGTKSTITYTVVSGGHAIVESMKMPAPQPDMVTVYHRDHADLVATHYCSMGNQPRMRAIGANSTAKSIPFRFIDITNLAKPGGGHIKDLTVVLKDDTHLDQQWTSVENGKEQTMTFHWVRKSK
ncbi:MAG: hypothetical protein HY821_24000 [Acidobacteria bacterium]|nr:hypothetical protein [Acidobacteriota bacterium]